MTAPDLTEYVTEEDIISLEKQWDQPVRLLNHPPSDCQPISTPGRVSCGPRALLQYGEPSRRERHDRRHRRHAHLVGQRSYGAGRATDGCRVRRQFSNLALPYRSDFLGGKARNMHCSPIATMMTCDISPARTTDLSISMSRMTARAQSLSPSIQLKAVTITALRKSHSISKRKITQRLFRMLRPALQGRVFVLIHGCLKKTD